MTLDAYAAPTIVLIFNTVFNVMFILLLVFVSCNKKKVKEERMFVEFFFLFLPFLIFL
jgi:hypothetical protein